MSKVFKCSLPLIELHVVNILLISIAFKNNVLEWDRNTNSKVLDKQGQVYIIYACIQKAFDRYHNTLLTELTVAELSA